MKYEDNFLIESPLFVVTVAAPVGIEFIFNGVDFLFDAQETGSMYQDPFQTTVVLASGDTIGYIKDVALPTEG